MDIRVAKKRSAASCVLVVAFAAAAPVFGATAVVPDGRTIAPVGFTVPSKVEQLFGLKPLNIYDQAAPLMLDAFATQPSGVAYQVLASNIPIVMNPGAPSGSVSLEIDGSDSLQIPAQEWLSIKGPASLERHEAYLRRLGEPQPQLALGDDP